MSKLREQLFNLVNAINNFNMTTDWPACFSINMCLKYLSLYKVLLLLMLLLLLRSLKIDFLVRSPYATSQHRRVDRENSARSLRLKVFITQLAVKNLTPQRHELPTNKSRLTCGLSDKTDRWTDLLIVYYVCPSTNCCERFADA